MNGNYIEVKIPILDSVEEMEVVKTFNEEQLWYVCAIARAFEKSEKENNNYKQALIDIREYIKSDEAVVREYEDSTYLREEYCAKDILKIIDKVLGGKR